MSKGMDIDPGALQAISGMLRDAGSQLDSVAGSAPGRPDAGEGTGALLAILDKLTESAGQLVAGSNAAGDEVAKSHNSYQEVEHTNADSFQQGGRR